MEKDADRGTVCLEMKMSTLKVKTRGLRRAV